MYVYSNSIVNNGNTAFPIQDDNRVDYHIVVVGYCSLTPFFMKLKHVFMFLFRKEDKRAIILGLCDVYTLLLQYISGKGVCATTQVGPIQERPQKEGKGVRHRPAPPLNIELTQKLKYSEYQRSLTKLRQNCTRSSESRGQG